MDVKTTKATFRALNEELECYTMQDAFHCDINIGISKRGVIIQDCADEVLIPVENIETFRTLLRYAEAKCKSKALAAQGDSE